MVISRPRMIAANSPAVASETSSSAHLGLADLQTRDTWSAG
jgi:hypothetical protein